MTTFKSYLEQAKQLPTHVDGVLADHYTFFSEKPSIFHIIYYNDDIVNVFYDLGLSVARAGKDCAEGYYVTTKKTYRENGTVKPKSEWKQVLMFHKKWARTDVEVKSVTYDVVGLKRETSKLPAGVLISNVNFNF